MVKTSRPEEEDRVSFSSRIFTRSFREFFYIILRIFSISFCGFSQHVLLKSFMDHSFDMSWISTLVRAKSETIGNLATYSNILSLKKVQNKWNFSKNKSKIRCHSFIFFLLFNLLGPSLRELGNDLNHQTFFFPTTWHWFVLISKTCQTQKIKDSRLRDQWHPSPDAPLFWPDCRPCLIIFCLKVKLNLLKFWLIRLTESFKWK